MSQDTPAPVVIHAQYIKDLSFENPNSPQSILSNTKPDIHIDVDVQARKGNDEKQPMHEVILTLKLRAEDGAKKDQKILFIAELEYAALVSLNTSEDGQELPLLLIEVPRLIFPYSRKIISSLTADGSFPPLTIHPIDFTALFREKYLKETKGNA